MCDPGYVHVNGIKSDKNVYSMLNESVAAEKLS
jgi:hypothetical protein